MGEGSGRGSGRVRLFVGNRGSGRVNVSPGRVGSKKSDPWTTLGWSLEFLYVVPTQIVFGQFNSYHFYMYMCLLKS